MLFNNNEEEIFTPVNDPPDLKTQWTRNINTVEDLVLSRKHSLAHELAEHLSGASSNEDEAFEYDDLPMLESARPSSTTESVMVPLANDESIDRLSDTIPEGELHMWVYEARQLSGWKNDADTGKEHGLRVRCSLLGAVQQSPCSLTGKKNNPVWRHTESGARDGMGGHFAWALKQPEEATGDGISGEMEANDCNLNIDVVCGDYIVGSASVELEDFLLSSRAAAFQENDANGAQIIRLSPHWLPLTGTDAGLLQLSLEFVPHKPQENEREKRFEPREIVQKCQIVPWMDQRQVKVLQQDEEETKVIVSRSGGVTMYIPTQGDSTPLKPKVRSPPFAPKSSFGLGLGGDQEQLMDKQLWDLYYFGIANDGPEDCKTPRDSDGFASLASSDFSDRRTSVFSRQASTCASDVLAYNELIQDMESVIKSMADDSTISNQESVENEDKSAISSTPKLHLKLRRLSKSSLNLRQPLDRIQSFWQETKARASNNNNSPKKSPVNNESLTPSSSKEGFILFDPHKLPLRVPYQRATSRDQMMETERERRVAAAGPRRRSLPVNSFSMQHRQEMLLQQQKRPKRSILKPFETQVQPSLLASVDPPLLSRARSDSLHSLTDLYLPKTGDGYKLPDTVTSEPQVTQRRHSGSYVMNTAKPLCVGKLINVGNVPGVVRYIGTTRFATGTWVGIELCDQKGKNNGTVDGETYFTCALNHGIFIRASRLDPALQ